MEFSKNISELLDSFLQGKYNQKRNELPNLAASDTKDEEKTNYKWPKILTSIELLLRIFKNNYDSSFNILIEDIFQQIQNLLDFYYCEKNKLCKFFSINEFLNVIYLIVDIIVSNPTEENINKLSDFYYLSLSKVELTTNKEYGNLSSFSEELSTIIRIISYIYEAVHNAAKSKHYNQPIADSIDMLMSNFKKNNTREYKLFFLLIKSDCDALAAETLLNVIPKHVKFSKNDEILQYIWEELSKSLSLEDKTIRKSKIILILCCLSDLYFIDDQNNLIEKIFNDKNYWVLLQKGLTSVACSVRKQTLHLLKISIKNLIDCLVSKRIAANNLNIIYKSMIPHLIWDKYLVFKIRNEFEQIFIILEYLEEKQIHLVKPIFENVQKFVTYYVEYSSLHISWIIIIFQRMLTHDNVEVVKWGILTLLKIPIEEFYDEEIITNVIHLLISSLNCNELYFNNFEVLLEELKNYFKTCLEAENGHLFFKILIKEISNIRWSSEALFFVINAISFIDKKNFWGKNEIELIKKLITSGIANHYTYIKSGMLHQLLLLSINLINTEELSLKEIFCFLSYFCRKECLRKEAEIWNRVTYWIKNSFAEEDVKNFVVELINVPWNVKESNIGKIIVLLNDTYNETFSLELKNLIKSFLTSFVDIHARPYCNAQIQEHFLSIVHDIISQESDKSELFNVIKPFLPNIVTYIELQLNSMHHIRDFDSCHFYMKILRIILRSDEVFTPELVSIVDKWLENIVRNLEVQISSDCNFQIQKFIQIKTLNLILDCNLCKDLSIIIEDLMSYLKTDLNLPLVKTSHETHLSNDLQTLWGKMNSEYLAEKWFLFSKIIDSRSPQEFLNLDNSAFLQLCFKILDIVGGTALLPLMDVLDKTLPSLTNEPDLESIILELWFAITARKKNEDYYQLMKSFIDFTFKLDLEINDELDLSTEDAKSPCLQILANNDVNESNLVMKRIQMLKYEENIKNSLSNFLSCALLYGWPLKKDEKLIGYISSFIEKMKLSPLKNDCSTSNEVRGRAVQVILTFNPKNECHCHFVSHLIDNLIKREKMLNKNRYFADSYVHRINQRLMQSLLILQLYTTKEETEKLFKWLMDKLIIENHQPSVRYLQEWLIMRILYKNPCLRDAIWSYFSEGVNKRYGSLCSLISIVYHSVKFISLESKASWIDNAVKKFLPCCMAQHFNVRLYAQVALQKLMVLAERLNLTIINEKYGIIAESLGQSIQNGKTLKNFVKLDEDFYFNVFDPVEHYSLETIFFDIPRLTNVCADEWITDSLLLNCGIKTREEHIPLRSENKALKSIFSSTWAAGGAKQNNDIEDIDNDIRLENLQKKIIPAKYLVPDSFSSFCDDKKNRENGLIVVASLIDRIPNLGGLSRTCEIFGVSNLVIGSLHYTEDKQFQSLSVTAEKWISISEVKPYNLSEFLIKMKRNGYEILAAEQTLHSKPLNEIRFPKKSLILLGNEKEGIPVNLLPLMDICVEIPQMGNIRSLNVHVTGALFIWEYTKQHYLSSQKIINRMKL